MTRALIPVLVRSAPARIGVAATMRLVGDPALDGVTGRYFDGQAESRAHPQAYDGAARRRLRELSEQLVREPARKR